MVDHKQILDFLFDDGWFQGFKFELYYNNELNHQGFIIRQIQSDGSEVVVFEGCGAKEFVNWFLRMKAQQDLAIMDPTEWLSPAEIAQKQEQAQWKPYRPQHISQLWQTTATS